MVAVGCFCSARIVFSFIGAWCFLSIVAGSEDSECPKPCFCNVASKIVYCSRRGMNSIPDSLPPDSLQLNLNGNQMRHPVIKRANLSHLTALEHLYLSECAIEGIEVGAFGDLPDLRWLDLSNNQIKIINERTFDGLKLQHLFLNGNRNLVLLPESFEGLDSMGLYLHDCSVGRIRPDVLAPLERSLKNLWLNGNEIERLDRRFEDLFSRLQHLRLGTNPLRCSCDAVWLKEFFDRNQDAFRGSLAPSCLTPRPLKGRYFTDLSVDELRCRTPQFTAIEGFFDVDSGRLSCSASGEPAPVLYWIQPSGKTSKFLPLNEFDDEATSSQNEALLTLKVEEEVDRAHLSGMYICVANNEAGNVTLSITVPWPPPQPHSPPVLFTLRTPTPEGSKTPKSTEARPRLPTDAGTTFSSINAATVSAHLDSRRLLGDSLKLFPPSTISSTTKGKHYEYLDVPLDPSSGGQGGGGGLDGEERLFTVGEMTWAVVGTHLLTLLLCVLIAIVCHKRRRTLEQFLTRSNMQSMDYCNEDVITYDKTLEKHDQTTVEDPALSESVYLNSLRHHRFKYYMDPLPVSSENPMIIR